MAWPGCANCNGESRWWLVLEEVLGFYRVGLKNKLEDIERVEKRDEGEK